MSERVWWCSAKSFIEELNVETKLPNATICWSSEYLYSKVFNDPESCISLFLPSAEEKVLLWIDTLKKLFVEFVRN